MLVILSKSINFAVTVHTTLPIRTASQGVSFAFIPIVFTILLIHLGSV